MNKGEEESSIIASSKLDFRTTMEFGGDGGGGNGGEESGVSEWREEKKAFSISNPLLAP